MEKNPHDVPVILVQKSLKTDNSESSYDTFWFFHGIYIVYKNNII